MRKRKKNMALSTFLLLLICPVFWTVSGERFDYLSVGDIMVAALLPITKGVGCRTENPTGILYAEAVIYNVVQHWPSEQQNYTLGYTIHDTCETAPIAAMAASRVVDATITSESNQTTNENHNIVAVIIDGHNSEVLKAIKEKLDPYDLPQILIKPRDFTEPSLRYGITRASSDLIKLLDHSWVAVRGSGGVGVPSFLRSNLRDHTTCFVGDVGDNPRGVDVTVPRKDNEQWGKLFLVDLGVIVSGVGRGMEVVKEARSHGVNNKTWLLITEKLKHYYYLKQPSDNIFVLSKNGPKVSPELLLRFHGSLAKLNESRPWQINLLKDFLRDWSPFLKQYPCQLSGRRDRLIENLNDVADIFNTVSTLRLALEEMLYHTGNASSLRIRSLRKTLKTSYLNGSYFKQLCNNSVSYEAYQKEGCSSEGYTLSKPLGNSCHRWTLQPVGTWRNSSGWAINHADLMNLKQKSETWKCLTGVPVRLRRYLDNCTQKSCLTCPTNSQTGIMTWANDYCRLCTVHNCSDVPLSYVSFTNTFALLVTCLCVIGEILLILVVVIFTKFRETPVVKSSNRMFNFFTLTTLGLWFAVIPTFLGRPNYFSCNVFMAFFPIVYATVSSIQLNKTIRLLLIFKSMQQPSKLLGNTSFFFSTIALILIQVFLGVLNFMTYPVYLNTVFHYDAVLLYCGRRFSPIAALELTYNCLLSIVCGVLAYRARKLPQNFNEAKNMSFAIMSYTISWTMIIAGYYDETFAEKQTAVVSLGLAIGAFSVLVCLFFPKVRVILFYPQLNTKSANREGTRRYSVDASANIGAVRPQQRSRSSTFDFQHTCPRPVHEETRASLNNNGYRPRTVSDSSFLYLVSEGGHRHFSLSPQLSPEAGTPNLPNSV